MNSRVISVFIVHPCSGKNMKNQLLTGALAVGTLLIGSAAFSQNASAFDLKNCKVVPPYASACQYVDNPLSGGINDTDGVDGPGFNTSLSRSSNPQRIVNVNNVNTTVADGIEGFFGKSSWEMFDRIEADFGQKVINWTGYSHIMAIFKDGANSTILGHLLKTDTTVFNWSGNPWPDQVGITGGNISHVSFYGIKGTPPDEVIPTPAAVLPGLLGMGAAVFRKKKQEGDLGQEA
jgi:hypothetical protein